MRSPIVLKDFGPREADAWIQKRQQKVSAADRWEATQFSLMHRDGIGVRATLASCDVRRITSKILPRVSGCYVG